MTQTTTGQSNVVPYTGEVKVLTGSSPDKIAAGITDAMADGWQLVGPVQVACGTDVDGGWNESLVATLERGVRF